MNSRGYGFSGMLGTPAVDRMRRLVRVAVVGRPRLGIDLGG